MTQTRKLILAAVGLALLASLLYAPHSIDDKGMRVFFGYGWIFSPPKVTFGIGSLDFPYLFAEWAAILLIGGIAWSFTYAPSRNGSKELQSRLTSQVAAGTHQSTSLVSNTALAWRRFIATHIDYVLVVLGYLTVTQMGLVTPLFDGVILFGYLETLIKIGFCIVLFQAICQVVFGTTPGKALLGIRLTCADGKPLRLGQAADRSLSVLFEQYAAGFLFPILPAVLCFRAFKDLKANGQSTVDVARGFVVQSVGSSSWRLAIGSAVLIPAVMAAATLNGFQVLVEQRKTESENLARLCKTVEGMPEATKDIRDYCKNYWTANDPFPKQESWGRDDPIISDGKP
jgi:uncharacterized RDD family membrane protein YckC